MICQLILDLMLTLCPVCMCWRSRVGTGARRLCRKPPCVIRRCELSLPFSSAQTGLRRRPSAGIRGSLSTRALPDRAAATERVDASWSASFREFVPYSEEDEIWIKEMNFVCYRLSGSL